MWDGSCDILVLCISSVLKKIHFISNGLQYKGFNREVLREYCLYYNHLAYPSCLGLIWLRAFQWRDQGTERSIIAPSGPGTRLYQDHEHSCIIAPSGPGTRLYHSSIRTMNTAVTGPWTQLYHSSIRTRNTGLWTQHYPMVYHFREKRPAFEIVALFCSLLNLYLSYIDMYLKLLSVLVAVVM